ncbi:MAG: aquaporin [bacterium]|nr:aquaporin [bacterium]
MFLLKNDLLKRLLAEFVGTYLLALTVLHVTTGNFTSIAPFAIAGVLMVLVYLLGGVSGAHFNPSVTIGLLVVRKISAVDALVNIIGQIAGAVVALEFSAKMLGVEMTIHSALSTEWFYEMMGAFVLCFAVAGVVHGVVSKSLSGAVIGLGLFVGIIISERVSGGVLNPALVIGMGNLDFTYLISPIIGGIAANLLALFVFSKN